MQTLLTNKEKIFEIKKKVEEKNAFLFNHLIIPNIPISKDAISIVMTASNRSKQTYFTLKTIQNSSYKNIHIIIVDDSDEDPITEGILKKYPFYIDFISIKKENKNWVNPVVNYNIGFEFIKGNKVVIQNAEVCHIGDVLYFIGNKMEFNNYYVCDVKSAKSLQANSIIYNNNTKSIEIYNNDSLFGSWYQGRKRMVNYHFLTGMSIDTFNKIKHFSYDYSFGISFDDNDFLLKIIANKIEVKNLFHDEYNFGGIHLWHSSSMNKIRGKIETNKNIFLEKRNYYKQTGKYIDFIFTIINDQPKIKSIKK